MYFIRIRDGQRETHKHGGLKMNTQEMRKMVKQNFSHPHDFSQYDLRLALLGILDRLDDTERRIVGLEKKDICLSCGEALYRDVSGNL